MPLPPAKHFAWPARVGVASCLTSMLTLVRNDDFNLAVTSVVFAVVVTIVAASDTLGATLATSWAIVGGATIGCIMCALCVALFGTSVAAVLAANALVGVAVLYPKFPVLSQKFAFGGSTIFAWTAFAGADARWMALGIPLSAAAGACSAILVTAVGGCGADDAVAAAADACAAATADAVAGAVAAYAAADVSAREAERARVESNYAYAERALARMKGAAAHAAWERGLARARARVFAGLSPKTSTSVLNLTNDKAPEASAGAFAEATLHLRGMTLALDALAQTQVQRWHLLLQDPRDLPDFESESASEAEPFAEPALAAALEETASRVADAARAAAAGASLPGDSRRNGSGGASDASDAYSSDEANGARNGAQNEGSATTTRETQKTQNQNVARGLRLSLAKLDAALTRQRRKHYAPGGRASDAGESVARRALQANHLWMFNFQSLATTLASFLDGDSDVLTSVVQKDGVHSNNRKCATDEVLCEACGDLEERRERVAKGTTKRPKRASSLPASFAADKNISRFFPGNEPRETLSSGGRDGVGEDGIRAPRASPALLATPSTPTASKPYIGTSPKTSVSSTARFPANAAGDAVRADTVGALLRCDFALDAKQLAYATKLSCAATVAGAIGWATSGSGLWAAVTVAMVGTREGRAVGGSFDAALLRMQGTVIGAMFSFALAIVVTGGNDGNDVTLGASLGRLILLSAFTTLTAFLRLNPEFAYAGVVAAFTAYVVALGVPEDADVAAARAFAHERVEQNLLGLLVLVLVEFAVFPVFAHDAARVAAGHTVFAAKTAAETVYAAATARDEVADCARCRARAAEDASASLDAVGACLATQKTLLVQAAAEPYLWSPPFPLRAHQQMVTDLENTSRALALMRKALRAMAAADGGGGTAPETFGSDTTFETFETFELRDADPRARIASLLAPTDVFVTELRRAVKSRLSRAADDLVTGSGRWSSRAAAASVARAQSRLERAFILHTLAMRERFRAGETEMFLPNALMVPWHAYVACTGILAATVESLGAASWDALLAAAETEEKAEAGEEALSGEADFSHTKKTERDEAEARASAVRAMRAKRDEAETDEAPFAGLREVRVEDEAVGTRL